MSTKAITLSDKIQIVLRFYGEADAIHENYDFVHCTTYWTSTDANLTRRQPALERLLCKELRRSEEPRVGKECVSTRRSRGSQDPSQKHHTPHPPPKPPTTHPHDTNIQTQTP